MSSQFRIGSRVATFAVRWAIVAIVIGNHMSPTHRRAKVRLGVSELLKLEWEENLHVRCLHSSYWFQKDPGTPSPRSFNCELLGANRVYPAACRQQATSGLFSRLFRKGVPLHHHASKYPRTFYHERQHARRRCLGRGGPSSPSP